MSKKIIARASTAMATLAACAGISLASAGAASAGVLNASGVVRCAGEPVVGVWVNAGSSSGWAKLGSAALGGATYSRSIGLHPFYTLTVGCGGTSAHWGSSNHAQGGLLGMVSVESYQVSCNDHGSCFAYSYDGGVE